MKTIFSLLIGLTVLTQTAVFAQRTQIAFQGFEGTGSDTWGIVTGTEQISTATGSTDTPANQRIRTGTKSWQINGISGVLELNQFAIDNYDSVKVTIHLSCPSVTTGNGSEESDSVSVFISTNNSLYSSTPDISITGNGSSGNARWGYDANLIASSTAGNYQKFTAPQINQSTNNYATIEILILGSNSSVGIKVYSINSGTNELWCIDDISLTGVSAPTGPTIYQPTTPQNFSTTTGVPDTNIVNVSFSTLVSGIYPAITGTNASLFTVVPDSIIGSTPSPYGFRVIYLPDATGTHTATLTFSSAGATSREVTLNGATLATEPTAQPTNLNFTDVTNTSFTVNYTAAAGSPSGYIALRRTGSAPSSSPVDGISYSAGNTIGDATVAYAGSNTTFSQTGLSAGTTYYYKIYSYNGSGNGTNYLTTSPLSGSQLTTGGGSGAEIIFPGVYGDSLLARLVASYKPSSTLGYDSARDVMYSVIDVHNGKVRCVYGGYEYNVGGGYNTEHTYPSSKFDDHSTPRGDMYHLYPTRPEINSARSNYPFNEIPDNLTGQWWRLLSVQTTIPTSNIDEYSESRTNTDFEPREDHKGNAARSVFYIYTMYKPDCDGADPDFFHIQKNVLRQWHYQDPVDTAEQTRNNAIAPYQSNRKNPFILDSTLVRRAYFYTPVGINDDELLQLNDFTLNQNYPNPFNPTTTISFDLRKSRHAELKIFNALGQEIVTLVDRPLSPGVHRIIWDGKDQHQKPVASGVYLYRLKIDNKTEIKKLLLLK